jgi:hypothetical protein
MNSPPHNLDARIFTMQIIAGALLFGVVTFAGIAVFMVQNRGGAGMQQDPEHLPILTILAGVMLLSNATLSFIIPAAIVRSNLRRLAASSAGANAAVANPNLLLLGVRQASLIVSLALLEGAAFLGCIAYLMEGQVVALACVFVGLCLMVWNFPTNSGVANWLDRHQSLLEELRDLESRLH